MASFVVQFEFNFSISKKIVGDILPRVLRGGGGGGVDETLVAVERLFSTISNMQPLNQPVIYLFFASNPFIILEQLRNYQSVYRCFFPLLFKMRSHPWGKKSIKSWCL